MHIVKILLGKNNQLKDFLGVYLNHELADSNRNNCLLDSSSYTNKNLYVIIRLNFNYIKQLNQKKDMKYNQCRFTHVTAKNLSSASLSFNM